MYTSTSIDTVALLKEIYDSTYDYGIFTFDLDGKITTWNIGAERIMGFQAQEMLGQNAAAIFTPEDRVRQEPLQEMEVAKTTGRAEDYRWHMRKDGSRFWADGVLTAIHDASGQQTGYLKIFRDATGRKLEETQLHRLANSDILTGVGNRHAFEEHLGEMIASTARTHQPLAFHLIDLDGFKQVNDSYGHHAGDVLLQQVAQRLQQNLRDNDFLARLGGDEFVVLQPNMSSLQAGVDFASRICQQLAQPFDIEGQPVQVSGSIGIALCPQDAADPDQLMKKADLALYRAKKEDKGGFRYFTPRLDADAHQKSRDIGVLKQAVAGKQFWVAYQPQIELSSGRIIGVEALLRSLQPGIAHYPIDAVVDLAIELGLMKNLSYWVLRQACTQLRQWKKQGLPPMKMCVNLCSQDMADAETPAYIDALLAELELSPSELEIEITERQALEIEKNGLSILQALRRRGIRIALDDFGTGYSALSYLRDLPVTAVKLDKSFLVGIPEHEQGTAVVSAVMALSHALGLEIIAEGVETDAQLAFLQARHCDAMQGFLVSEALTADDMTDWLANADANVNLAIATAPAPATATATAVAATAPDRTINNAAR
jgi:diguanylate cyclase (GGDEF)-like protein/PAS domain S-box-containing protein